MTAANDSSARPRLGASPARFAVGGNEAGDVGRCARSASWPPKPMQNALNGRVPLQARGHHSLSKAIDPRIVRAEPVLEGRVRRGDPAEDLLPGSDRGRRRVLDVLVQDVPARDLLTVVLAR